METIDIQIKSNIPQAEKETTSLREQVKELRKEMESCEVGTDEYNDAILRLSQAMHDLKDQQELVKNSSGELDTVFTNLQSVTSGVVSGFSAVSAAATLVGGNNENLQKTMVKLQAGMALVQGLKGFEGMGKKIKAVVTSMKAMTVTTKAQTTANNTLAASEGTVTVATKATSAAMKGLRAALIATGIGALIVLVGELINGLSKLFDWIKSSVQVTNEFKDANEKLTEKFEDQNDELDIRIKYMEADGATTKEVIVEKKKLIAAQIAETNATLANAKARLKQLQADSGWIRFWRGENKVIKELSEETIPALEEQLDALILNQKNLNADLYKAEKDEENKRVAAAKAAGEKALAEAKRQAEAHKKLIEDVTKKAENEFEKIVTAYKQMQAKIDTIRGAISTTTSALTDIDAWRQVYGTDPNQLEGQLVGVNRALASYAADQLFDEFSKMISGQQDDDVRRALTEKYIEALGKVGYDVAHLIPEDIDVNGVDLLAPVFHNIDSAAQNVSKDISKTFTDQFNALLVLYKDGIVDYQQFYDTLLNIQGDYSEKVAVIEETVITKIVAARDKELEELEERYVSENMTLEDYEEEKLAIASKFEARIAEIRHDYAIKPLSLQKEVGEQFLNELERQNKKLETNSERFWDVYNTSLMQQLQKAAGEWDLYSQGTLKGQYESEQHRLDFQKAVYDQEYEAKRQHIEDMLALNILSAEQETKLKEQLETLNREKLNNDIEYYENSAAARDEYYSNLQEAVTQGISAMADLSDNLANVFTKAAETMKNADGTYTQEGIKMLETSAALQIATATMNAAAGIATVWATSASLGPIAGPIVAGIQTAAHLANLAVQIMTIKNSLAQAKAGNTSGGATAAEAPDVSASMVSTDAYQTTLSDETTADLQRNARSNSKVYVVESDITDKQDDTKTTVTTATF